MKRPFVVINTRGPSWDDSRAIEEQADWPGHAKFMDALVDDGFVILGGTLEGSRDVVLVIQGEDADAIHARLAPDPWMRNGLLRTKGLGVEGEVGGGARSGCVSPFASE
jgi:hypothetical protein